MTNPIIAGLDLGQSIDHSALVFLECGGSAPLLPEAVLPNVEPYPECPRWQPRDVSTPTYSRRVRSPNAPGANRGILQTRPAWDAAPSVPHITVTHIRQYPLGTSYVAIARDVARKINAAAEPVTLAIDAAGPGKPVIDLLSASPNLQINRLLAITNTGASRAHRAAPRPSDPAFLERWFVPKPWLFRTLSCLINTGRFTIADIPNADLLLDEFRRITTRFTEQGHIKHAARTGHDDLVLATVIACWAAISSSLEATI